MRPGLATAALVALPLLAASGELAPAAQDPAARAPSNQQTAAPFGPQPGVRGERRPPDLKTLLYYAADGLGMLRGGREIDMVLTMEFWATGSITVDGKPCPLSSYRASLRYPPSQGSQNPRLPVPALRTDFACTSANGKPGPRQIHVVAGHLAWNERTPGLLAGPAPDTARERLLHVWTVIPEGVVKAAIAAGNAAELRTNAANPIVSFPLPAPFEAAIMTATFDSRIFRVDTNPAGVKREFSHLLQQTVTRIGTSVVETTYSDYGDWNDEDLKSMILLPRRIVQKKDGVTTLDLTITRSDTYNPYVVMPVPEGVARAAAQP